MTSPDKKYIAVDRNSGETFRFNAEDWANSQKEFMTDFPDAEIVEYDAYKPENLQDNDTIFVDTEDGQYTFTPEEWKENEEEFRKDFKTVNPTIARGYDYHYNSAKEIEGNMATQGSKIADWEQRRKDFLASLSHEDSAKIDQLDIQKQSGVQGMPLNENDPIVAQYNALMAEGDELKAEQDRLRGEYEANPRVKTAMEEWAKEYAQYKAESIDRTRNEIAKAKEEGVDLSAAAQAKIAKVQSMSMTGAMSAHTDLKGLSELQKLERLESANYFLDMAQDAKDGKMNGFWKGMKDVGSAFVETIKNRGDIANYVDIFNIMKKLEEKVGNLKNITDEEIDNNLTESERLLLKSYFEYADAIANADTDWKYKAGQIGGEGIKFAIEFALTAGASGAVSSAVTKGLTDGIERWAMKAIGNGAKKWLVQAAEKAAIGATRGALNVVLQTALRPSTYAQMAQKSIEIDEYGHLNGAKNSAISFIDSTIETLSEMSGDAIGKLLGFIPMKGVKGFAGKMFDKTLGMTKFGQYGKALLKGVFGDYLKAAGFHGAPIEMLEEVVGSALREMTIDDKAFEESFGGDNKYAMALGFLPMTFMGGAFSMAGLGASQIAAKNASSALAATLANYKFADGRIKALTDYQSDMSPLQMQLEAKEIISELKKNGASEADIETVNNYMTSKAGYLAMRGAKSEQDAEDRANVIADMESQYGDFYQKKDGMNEVTVAVLNDGRRVFITSEKNENGEFSAIDQTTGKGTIINESDIKTIDTPIGISQQVMTRMSLDEYASNAINERMQLAEIERMSNERNAQIAELSRLLPKAINLGTTGEPNMVAVKSQDQKGVTVVDAEGNEAVLSWDEVGMKMGAPIKVLTDAQIAEAEAAEIGLSRAERRAQRAKTEGQANAVDAEVNAINEEMKDVTPAPEEAYTNPENGLVDEDAFWEGDPEGFCDWNDRLNNDGGQDSREQIESSLMKLQAKMDQTRKLAMDEPKARRAVKAEMQKLQERIDRLTALQQKYAEMAMTEEQKAQERAELVLLMRERVNQWRELLGLTEEDLVVYESLEEVEDQNAINQIARAKTEGWYSGASKRAFLFLPDITSLDELDAKVMHEVVTHYGLDKVMTPEAKNQLLDAVWGMMSDAARRAYLSYPGVNTLNGTERQRAAANEFMAKVAESVKVGNASAEQKSVWQRIVDFFNNLFKKVNAFFNGADVADFVLENYRLLTNNIKPSMPTAVTEEIAVEPEISQSEVDTQVETIFNESGLSVMEDLAENVMAQAETMTNEEGMPLTSNTNDGTELFSTTTAKPWTDNLGNEHKGTMEMVLERMQQMEFSEQEIRQMEAKMQTAYDYMMKLQSLTNPDGSVRFEEFNAWAEKTPLYKQVGRDFVKAITSLVSNGDYPINLELTTDCIKREAFTMLLNELVKRGADLAGMGPAEIVTIQKMMKQYGIQVACALCFVEGKRLQIVNWASQIVNDWNDALIEAGVETDEMFEFGKDGDAFIPSEEWRTYEDKPKLAKVLRTIDEVARIFQGVDPKVYKAQKAKNESALKKYIKEKEEAAAKKGKKWTPTDEQKRDMKKIKVAGLTPTYVNENMKEYTAAFEQMRNEWVAKSPKKGPMRDPLDFTPTKTQWDELEKIRNRQIENVKQKMVRLIMEYPEMRKKMTLNDLLGSKGLMEIRQQHGVAYEQLYSIILQRFGTGTPKPVQDAVPYDGEVMTLTESAFKAANKIGGARLFSFSDFDITKVFDYMQMFFDLEANRQMLQSYTKEVAAVLLFGKSNAKFNISTLASAVVPAEVLEEYENASEGKRKDMRHQWAENAGLLVDENGTITGINFSEEHSVSPEFAQQIFHDDSRNKDCGAIMVGASVNHAIYSAAQAWIRMVIPFHLSGMPIAARDKTDVKWWTDNTEYQSTRKKTKDGWSKISDKENTFEFYADMHQEGWNMRDKAREYLDWCKDNAFRPKFDWGINSDYYRAYCEENGYTPNQQIIDMMDADTTNGVWNQYYKFLTDFTAYKPVFNEEGEMIDEIPSPQQRVISNFDMSEMEKQVIFEGENSMLARREGNIELANQHVSELADKVTPYLNGQITEEEMGLRDDVFYDARKDANAYLEATGNLLYSSTAKRRARKQLPEDLKMKEVVEKYGGIWIGNRQEYAKFVSAVNNWYFEKDGIGLVYADIHHMYQYYWNENGEPIPFRKFYISDSTRERIDNLIEQENEQRADITVREITSENYDFVKNVEANAEGSTLDNTSVPMPLGDDNMAEDLLGEGAYANNPELYVTSSRPNKAKAKILFSTSNRNQAIFVSNAAKAVEGIKQEKATPEQWLKMIEKNGGLKAGEDKWMGLSDFLKASDKKTLTKAEVLDFINEHMIVIEEQHYSNEEMGKASVKILNEKYQGWEDAFSFEWDGYMEEPNADLSNYEAAVELYNKHHDDKVALDGDGEFENMDDYEKVRQFGVELSEIYHGSKSEVRPIDGIREQYTTQGLQHLHEIALTVPTIESWRESDDIHFGDAGEGRAVAWIRFGDASKWVPEQREDGKKGRTKKVLVIDEIQSKRHQEGREKGYASNFETSPELERLNEELDTKVKRRGELIRERVNQSESEQTEIARIDIALDEVANVRDYDRLNAEKDAILAHIENRDAEISTLTSEIAELESEIRKEETRLEYKASEAVPDAPFEKNWSELAMKRMLRYAAENGYDAIAWTKGEQQVSRYNLGGVVSAITMAEEHDGFIDFLFDVRGQEESSVIGVEKETGIVHLAEEPLSMAEGKPLSELVGKEIAEKMMQMKEDEVLDGQNLRIGGEGMKGFYDKMLPAFMNKYGKKWGVKVEDIHLNLENGLDMHSVPVTDEMKESVMEGQLMFSTKSATFESAITPEVRKEMDVIAAQAFVNGNYLLAPNGQPTKLTPEQWALVRTKNFLNWFGDWINDPENASKVVDENGEPMVVYHGTPNEFWSFDKGKIGSTNDPGFWGEGFYFTSQEALAVHYAEGGRVLPVFLNIRNPHDFAFLTKEYYDHLERFGMFGDKDFSSSRITEELTKEGKDGVIRRDSYAGHAEYIAFEPNQIKSATDNTGEFSESEDIRFSTDSHGKSLTPGQQTFFANSKAVDKDGNLLVLYHGTPRAGFTEFESGWFTTSKEDAISYSGDRKGRIFDPNEEYVPETLTAGDFPLGYMTFDSEEDRAAFLAEHPTAESVLSESEYENARMQAEDEEYDALTERKPELQEIWDDYREYERDHFVDTTIGDILNNSDSYTEDDLRRAILAYDSNAVFDYLDEINSVEERKSAMVDALNYMNEDAKENGSDGILDITVATRVPRNGEGIKHNDTGNRTYEVYANIERPYEIDADGRHSEFESGDIYKAVESALKDDNYDGIIIRNWRVGRHQQVGDVVVPKNGSQVKLTSNENPTESNGILFSARQPYESAKAFIQTETDKFYETYNTTLPAKVVYANSRKMIAEALGYKVEEMPDALYKAIREEAKKGYACVVSIDDKSMVILVFPREDVNQTAKVSRILFHENIHPMISDKPELLDLGKWLIENPVGIAEGVAEQVKSQYAEEDWDEEMVCDYIGAMLSLGRSQEALDVVPEEYKPLLNYVYERFGYKPESEDPRRRSERLGDARELQMRNSENEGGNEGNSGYLFSTTGREKSVEEIVEEGKQKVSAEHTQTVDAFMDRIRRINGNLQQLRMAAAAQREYDQKTVKTITDIANDLLEGGALNDLTRGEIKRLLSIINGGVGKSDLTKSVNRLMDLMVANQLRYGKSLIEKFLKIRGSKVDQRGVEVRGTLDIPGQQMLAAFKEGIGLSKDKLADRIAEAEDALSSDSETKKRNAENELVGFYLAKQYHEDIYDSIEEEKDLRNEIKVADEDYKAGKITKEMHKQLLDTIYEAILENRIQRVNAYEKLASDLGAKMVSSIKNAGLLRDAEKERVQKIQHFANSDMQGMPADMHGVKENRFWNSPLVRFFLKPLATFDQMLRSFAPKSTSGEGYLWNHFMGGWTKATESEYKGVQEAHEMLDSAARTMFGEGVERWSDLFAKERKMPKIAIKVWDNGEMVDKEISQGNALYIYMVNKMTDGKMKLRKMGISQEDVDAIVAQMDPRFITLADWMQERFLPSLRDKYNAVHERLFGAPMASIDNYFPIKVNPGARTREVDVEAGEGTAKPATITGSIIKRTKNSLALDIMNADAFDVMLEHIQQMEHWAAFAEFNKDLNTLLSYRKFRNRVENMSGIYGSGKTVWSNFKTVAEIAAGVYQPASKSDSLDKTALNVAKGVTGAKISFRVYTAIKQLLSMPAFISDANIVTLAKNIATPWIAWNWAMENLPMFEKRWKSRQAGDTRLMQTDSDWKVWKYKIVELAGRYGMTPNAFIDAVTVSIGARSIYETKYQSYLDMGYSEEQADKKAKQDATVLFNESQQSNESAFLSAVQVDRTVASVAFTVFRNSAMGYQRMAVDAWRNISHMMRKGYKEESIEYMKKQMVRDGLTEEQAERAATRVYNRSFAKNAARLVTFQFLVQFAWNLGAYLPYLLVGDDDDEKKAMVKDAAIRGLVGGPIEGMAGGSIVSNMAGNLAMGEKLSDVNTTLLPVISDIEKTIKMLDYDKVAAYNEMFNILIQSGIGVNPQTFTDIIVAIEDACNGEPQTSKEVALCIMRALQVPQSQLEKVYFDEIDFTVDKGLDLTIEEFAKRYANYKVNRGTPLTGWMYEDEVEKEREDKYIKRFLETAEELKRSRGNEEAKKYYEYLDTDYKETTETINELQRKAKESAMKGDQVGAMEFAKMLDDFMKTDLFKDYVKFGGKAKAIESIRDKMKKVDMQTRESLEDMMLELRKAMVQEMEEANR